MSNFASNAMRCGSINEAVPKSLIIRWTAETSELPIGMFAALVGLTIIAVAATTIETGNPDISIALGVTTSKPILVAGW